MTNIIKPKKLKKGSVIGICAPSAAFRKDLFEAGVKVLEELGFKTKFSDKIFRKKGYLAGTDEERANDLNMMLSDPDIDAIMFARGGYGLQRIMNSLDFTEFKKNPKLVIGFSDITPLLSYINTHLNCTCLYGPVITLFAERNKEMIDSFMSAVTETSAPKVLRKDLQTIKEGEAESELLGGCLTMLSTSLSTRFELKPKDSILFLEDDGENIYRYDRLFTHLMNAGFFKDTLGIVLGPLALSESETVPERLWPMFENLFKDFKCPIVRGLHVGHTTPFHTIPLGVKTKLKATQDICELQFVESAIE